MNKIKEKHIFLLAAGMIWVYLWIRAGYVPIVYDEALTFFYYVRKAQFLPFFSDWDANNHFLNSFFSFLSCEIFGESSLALRLPNLLFFPVYALFVYKTGGFLENRINRIVFYAAMLFAHNFIEFFGMTRGYGMSMALLMAALFYLITAMRTRRTADYFSCLLWMLLAVSANLNLIFALLICLLLLGVPLFMPAQRSSARAMKLLMIVMLGIIPASFFLLILFKLREFDLLYYGDGGSFWESSLRTIPLLITGTGHPAMRVLFAVLLALFFGRFIYLIVFQIRARKLIINEELILGCLFFGNLAAMFAANLFLGVKFPEDRTGMHLYPLLAGGLLFMAQHVKKPQLAKCRWLILLPFLLFPVHFFVSLNFSHSSWWRKERIPQSFYDVISASRQPGQFPATVGGHFIQQLPWTYLNYFNGGSQNLMYSTLFPFDGTDFQIADTSRNPKLMRSYVTAEHDDISGMSLLKRKVPLEYEAIFRSEITEQTETWDSLSIPVLEVVTDTLAGEALYFCFDATLRGKSKPFRAYLIASVMNEKGESVISEQISFDYLRPEWEGETSALKHNLITAPLPRGVLSIKTYLWNPELHSLVIRGTCSLYRIKRNETVR